MKTTFLFVFLMLSTTLLMGQTFYDVTHLSGTAYPGACTDVTVSSGGSVSSSSSSVYCVGPYWEGPSSGLPDNYYSWHFAPGVDAIRIFLAELEYGDDVSFTINGTHFDFSTVSALTAFTVPGCAGAPGVLPTINGSGDLVAPLLGTITSAQIDITSAMIGGVPISDVTINCLGGTNGVHNTMAYSTSIAPITGPSTVCVGSSITLDDATPGGSWSVFGGTGVALMSTSGVLTGWSAGTVTVDYTMPGGCYVSTEVTVLASPDPIGGPVSVCEGNTVTFTDATTGGTWSSSGMGGVTFADPYVGVGIASPVGITAIHYILPSGCSTSRNFMVYPNPGLITVVDPPYLPQVCVGSSITLSNSVSGGVWSVHPGTGVALITFAGVVQGVNAGTVLVDYTLPGNCYAQKVITVLPLPAPIEGLFTPVCVGDTRTFTDATPGGLWSSDPATRFTFPDPTVGTGTAGPLTGPAIIRYTLSTGCSTAVNIIVAPIPVVIEGPVTSVIVGNTITLHGSPSGGSWGCTAGCGLFASVNPSTGVVTGNSVGSATITYEDLSTHCYGTIIVNVIDPFPVSVCETYPSYSCDNEFLFCGSGFKVIVSGGPAGTTYSWSPSISGYSSMTTSVVGGIQTNTYTFSSLPATTTYVVSSSLAGSVPRTVTIVKPTGTCNFCSSISPGCTLAGAPAFKAITATTLDASVISPTVTGYYYIENSASLKVSPAPGSVLLMGQDVIITVPNTQNIIIENCHMYSDPGCQWKGIVVQSTTTASGSLMLHNSLIEHASVAGVTVNADASGGALPLGGDIVNSDNTVFNNNQVGIDINFYSTQNILPFHIVGSVFTARNWGVCYSPLPAPASPTDYYPFKWASASYLRTPDGPMGILNDPAFNIDHFAARSGLSKFGIDMMDVGKTDLGSPNTYHYMTIGDPANADNANLFDTLQIEMRLYACNVTCYNNIFRHPWKDDHTYGIQALIGSLTAGRPNANQTSLRLLNGSVPGTYNRFYNCHEAAVSSNEYYNLISHNTEISATNTYKHYPPATTPVAVVNGTHGFQCRVKKFDHHEITGSNIRNVAYGITGTISTNPTWASGDFVVSNNVLEGITPSLYQYGNTAMLFDDDGTTTPVNDNLLITGNYITGWKHGIGVTTNGLLVSIENNNIEIMDNTDLDPEYGICVRNSTNIYHITGNEVFGSAANGVNYNTPLPATSITGGAVVLNGVKGIYLDKVNWTSGFSTEVSCNAVHDMNIGFKFDHQNKINWKKNSMKRNRFGMLLNYYWNSGPADALIGLQGSYTVPSDNTWDNDPAISWPGWGGTTTAGPIFGDLDIYQTYVIGQTPSASQLYVRSGALYTPIHNGTPGAYSGTPSGAAYAPLASLLSTSPTDAYSGCFPAAFRMVTAGTPEQTTPGQTTLATVNEVRYTVLPNPSNGDITIQRISSDLENSAADVRVVNAVGQVVYNGRLNFESGSADLKLNDVAPGMYYVHISGKNEEACVFKVVIQK
jgi:hypothetical protein